MPKATECSKPHVKKLQEKDDAAIVGKLSNSGSKTPHFSWYYQEGSNCKNHFIDTSPHGLESRSLFGGHHFN
jgi:hypothetical protein